MPKDLSMTLLLDVYGAVLTEKQRETLSMYYEADLSLGEISEDTGITRQGVMNCIRKSEAHLRGLEEQLQLVRRFRELNAAVDELKALASAKGCGEEIITKIDDIKQKL